MESLSQLGSEIIPPMRFSSEIKAIFGENVDRVFSSLKVGEYVYLQFSDDPTFLACAEVLQMSGSWMLLRYQNGDSNGVWCRFQLAHNGNRKLVFHERPYESRMIADYCFVRPTLSDSERGDDRPFDSRMTWVNLVDVSHRNNSDRCGYNDVYRETDVVCISDIHGDLGYLRRSLLKQGVIDDQDDWVAGNRVVVFSGDYIDEEDGLKVIDYLVSLSEKAAKAGGCVKLLCGNHDAEAFGAMVACDFDFKGDFVSKNASRIALMTPNFLKSGGREFLSGEVSKRYGVVMNNPRELVPVLKRSGCPQFVKSLELCTQVDDILFVHAGIDVESSRMIRDFGVDGVNKMWRGALVRAEEGDSEDFGYLNRVSTARGIGTIDVFPQGQGGMLWFDGVKDLTCLKTPQIQEICTNLKTRGINVIVVGHTVFNEVTLITGEFEKYGIKIVCVDVGGSDVVGFKAKTAYRRDDNLRGRTSCGVKVNRRGLIIGAPVSFDGDPVNLHVPTGFASQSIISTSVYNTRNRLVGFAVPSREQVERINSYDFDTLKRQVSDGKDLIKYYREVIDNPMLLVDRELIVTDDYDDKLRKEATRLLSNLNSPEFRVFIEVLIMHTQSQIELMEKRLLRFR